MPVQLMDSDDRIVVKDSELQGITDGDPETTYTLRPIGVDDYRRLTKAHTKKVLNRRTHQSDDEVDFAGLTDAVLDYVLTDWSGILFKGQPVPCLQEYKQRLDGVRRAALAALAGMNQIHRVEEVRAESFHEPPAVLDVLDRRETENDVLSLRH